MENDEHDSIIDKLKDTILNDGDLKREIYTGGRNEHIEGRSWIQKILYLLTKNNWTPIITLVSVVVVCALAYIWVIHPVFVNVIQFLGLQRVENGWAKIPNSLVLSHGHLPTDDAITKLQVDGYQKQNGKLVKEKTVIVIDKNGNAWAMNKHQARRIKNTPTTSSAFFRVKLQPSIGVILTPAETEASQIAEPALFINPILIKGQYGIDIFASTHRFGGGLSYKLPFKYTSNTFLGVGVAAKYDDIARRDGLLYVRINF